MKVTKYIFMSIFLFILLSCERKEHEILSGEQRQWLNQQDSIIFVPYKAYPPMDFFDSDSLQKGITVDILKLIEKRINYKFKFEHKGNWKEMVEVVKNNENHIIANIQNTSERRKYFTFTKPYISNPNAIIVNIHNVEKLNLKTLTDKKVAIVKGYATIEFIKEKNPFVEIVEVNDNIEALQLISFNQVDAAITDLAVASYYIDLLHISNLKVAGYIDFQWNLCFATHKDNDILISILQKGLKAISQDEKDKIYEKWIKLKIKPFYRKTEFWLFVSVIFAICFIVVGVVLTWNKTLKREVLKKTKELSEANKKLKKSERRFRLMTKNLPSVMLYQAVAITDEKRKFIYVSENIEELHEVTVEEALQNADVLYSQIRNAELADFMKKGAKALKNLMQFEYETQLTLPSGKTKWVKITSLPTLLEDGELIWDGVIIDITPYKTLELSLKESNEEYESINEKLKNINEELVKSKEKAEESDRLKTEFIHNMSHEIRTPLNGLLGFSDLLNEPELSFERRAEYVKIIHNCGNQLMKIIDDILEISRLETKQLVVNEKTINLNDLLLKLFSSFDERAKENKTPLYLKKSLSDSESFIISDEIKLSKILSKLLDNALKFTTKGFVEFGYLGKSKNIEIYVKDTGVGIAQNKQNFIFNRFSQAGKSSSKIIGGLGLGLSIAKANAELLGGTIKVKSEKGKGAIFTVIIPYKPVISDEELNVRKIKEKTKEQKTILIAEDEEINYLFLETLLETKFRNKYKILHAKNGQEAVKMSSAGKIDIILMDIKMPVMNGHEATKRIKKDHPSIPIIAQSAYSTDEDKAKAYKIGMDDFLEKPIKKDLLEKIINKHLKKRKPQNKEL